jgi:hypothetical protein
MLFKINGVYDLQTLHQIKDFGVDCVTFDMRPTSMNFIQLYKIKDMLLECGSMFDKFFLHFANEKDFMIENALTELSELDIDDKIFIEFDDLRSATFYEQFNRNYIWTYNKHVDLEKLFQSTHFQVLKLDEQTIASLEVSGELFSVLKNIFELKSKIGFEVEISCSWRTSIPMSIFDFFEFDIISLSINEMVENSYRNINMEILEKNFLLLKKQILTEGVV